jgi:hypothetical protein
VNPYSGELGAFEIGPGTRTLTNFSVTGSFKGRDCAVPVGGDITDGSQAGAERCLLPVGDYVPDYFTLKFGRLQIELSDNYHSEGERMKRNRPPVYGITIRKERPFVMDFSNQPDVMFASPTNSQRVKPGDTLMVVAVLVDPKLDIMIRRLYDNTPRQGKDAKGNALSIDNSQSLDPKVIITRASGEKVAEGVMPFG